MNKEALRVLYKQKRAALTEKECVRLNDLLLIQFQQLEIAYDANILMSYWPMEKFAEVNTFLMTDYLAFRIPGLQLAYPVTDPLKQTMKAVLVNDDSSFKKNAWGIAEPVNGTVVAPTDIDIIFVPLLAFDKAGHRLGYGKGFYDRFLPLCRQDVVKIGFSYFEPLGAIHGIDQFDTPLTTGITPEHIYEF